MPGTMSLPIEGGYARGKENMWFFELHILSPERENVRFFEPYILSPVLLELVRERKRECVVRRVTHSPSYFVGDGMREAGRMCGSKNHILPPVLWEMEREGERAVLRTTHPLSYLVGHGTREAGRTCGSSNHTFSLSFLVGHGTRQSRDVPF